MKISMVGGCTGGGKPEFHLLLRAFLYTMINVLPSRILTGFGMGLSTLILSFWLAWQILVPFDFGFTVAYQMLDLETQVQQYGPQNRYKKDFENTTSAEQKRVFAAMVQAIQHQGKGLEDIIYITRDGYQDSLLHEAEVLHLQDVAALIHRFNQAALASILILATSVFWLKHRRQPAPSTRHLLAGLGLLLALGIVILLAAGPTQAFYWLHTQIFPPGHQWFFYYQDSLMTTLMKAPDLFGFIGVLWLMVALPVLFAEWGILRYWLNQRPKK